MKNSALAVLLLLVLGSTGSATESLDWTDHANLPVVANPDPPADQVFLVLSEVWRLDCSEDADILVGRIEKAATGRGGHVLLLDTQLNQVLEIGAAGEVVMIYGGQGEGPGETTGAFDLCELADGRVAIMEGSPARTMTLSGQGQIHLLQPDGDPDTVWHPADESVAGEFPNLRSLRQAGHLLMVAYQLTKVSPPEMTWVNHLVLMNDDGTQRALLGEKVFHTNFSETTSLESDEHEPYAGGRFDIDATGRMAMVPGRDQYQVVVRHEDGSGFLLDMPVRGCPRTNEEVEELVELYSAGPYIHEALPNEPEIKRVRWRPDGRLWVEHCASQQDLPEGVFIRFDEFDATGRFQREVSLVVAGNPETDRLRFLSDGRFVMIRNLVSPGDESESQDGLELEVILFENPEPGDGK